MPERPVILTGFMGSGKSSVGRLLAKRLGCPFIDLDALIVAAAGKSINHIVCGMAPIRPRCTVALLP